MNISSIVTTEQERLFLLEIARLQQQNIELQQNRIDLIRYIEHAVNKACICGDGDSNDGCLACKVWHYLIEMISELTKPTKPIKKRSYNEGE